jgi:beta-lactamase superfamily II metal-dependent hydrolase
LIDAGGSGRILSTAIGDALPFWKRSLDMVVLTQPKEAQIEGLPDTLTRYQVETLITNGSQGGQQYSTILSTLAAQNTKLVTAQTGSRIVLGDGVTLTIRNTRTGDSESGDYGDPVSLLLSYGQMTLLLPGDLSSDAVASLLRQNVSAYAVFLVDLNHPALNDPAFLSAINPHLIITGIAEPAPDALAKLNTNGAEIHRLDQAGWIEIASDGKQITVRSER